MRVLTVLGFLAFVAWMVALVDAPGWDVEPWYPCAPSQPPDVSLGWMWVPWLALAALAAEGVRIWRKDGREDNAVEVPVGLGVLAAVATSPPVWAVLFGLIVVVMMDPICPPLQ